MFSKLFLNLLRQKRTELTKVKNKDVQDYKDTFGSQSFRLSKTEMRSAEFHVNRLFRGTLAQSVESWYVERKPVTGSIPSKKMKRLAFCPANS